MKMINLLKILVSHSSLAARELVGLARWLEAKNFVAIDSVAAAVAAVAVTIEAVENAVVGFGIVAEFVYFVVALNTGEFVGVTLRPG